MKVNNQNELMDVRSIIALHGDYSTAEPFIDWDWDGRVQKIGYDLYISLSTIL